MNKLNKLRDINYHDADVNNYNREGNNISFELKDGWEYDTYYKFELKNIKVQVMNNKPELICYVLDEFNNINEYGKINLYSGEIGKLEKTNTEGKYYLKLWIRHPSDFRIDTFVTMEKYKFDGLDVELCDDYDDTGRLYIKFITDDIIIEKIK
ncbi:MAG: hypothetical protein ACI4VL_00865 [Bacilli bacterium]